MHDKAIALFRACLLGCLVACLSTACASTRPAPVPAAASGISVDHAVMPAADPGGPVAAYAGFENAGPADRLLAVECQCAASVELHEVVRNGDEVSMANSFPLALPTGRTEVKPPGIPLHFMLIDTNRGFVAGERVPMRLHFENAGEMEVVFRVVEKSMDGWEQWSPE